jgi:hypothetical protein
LYREWAGGDDLKSSTGGRGTERLKHAVTLVEHEVLDFAQVEVAHLGKRLNPAGGADDDVWCFCCVRKEGLVLGKRCAAEDHLRPDVR